MTIIREKQIEINNAANTILEEYNFGRRMKSSVRKEINKVIKVHPATPLTVKLLMEPAPEGVDPEIFKSLVDINSACACLTNHCKLKMLKLFEPVIEHIIETEYAAYLEYRNDLEQEGSASVLICMNQDFPDPYTYYCRRINVEMYQFLYQRGLIKE